MYLAVVALTMFILPAASVVIEHLRTPSLPLIWLIGRWFVFWAVGVRLGLAGLRQVIQPAFTAKNIFHLADDAALPLIRELGIANVGTALVGLLSLILPTFTLPAAISAVLFYAVAGFAHLAESNRSLNENVAMLSDLWAAALLAVFLAAALVVH